MFRFGILLILCVFVCVVSVFAHDPPAGEHIMTVQTDDGTEISRSWGDSQVTISDHTDVNGVHVHGYKVTFTAAELGTDVELSATKTYGGEVESHLHSFPAHTHDDFGPHWHVGRHFHANPSDTHSDPHDVDDDHSTLVRQQPSHTHGVTHQHDGYTVHTHSLSHSHPNPFSEHAYTVSEVHERSLIPTRVHERSLIPPPPTPPPPTPPTGVGDGTPVVEESGTPEGTSSPQPVVPVVTESPPQETPPEPPPMQPIRVTEYMVRDWTAGIGGLPQWIEVYNPNTEAVNLKDYTFQYATRRSATASHKVHTLTLAGAEDGFSIPGGGVAILSTGTVSAWRFSGIEATQVYNLSIDNVLKRGWVLTDADGAEIHRLGRAAFGALGDPVAPLHQNKARVSHQVVPSESPPETYYYGHREDIGSPGFYKQPAPAAPSAVKRKRVGTWASLKRTP